MKTIEDRILKDGFIIDNDIIKVDSFLNHQIDPTLLRDFAYGVKEEFADTRIDKVLTIETSGIAVAYAVCEALGDVPLVFAKKSKSKTVDPNDVFLAEVRSFTRGNVAPVTVSKRFLHENENVLIVDDFLAEGNASFGLLDLCKQAGAHVIGVAVVIEKSFQGGRKRLEEKGVHVFSGASIHAFCDNKPVFKKPTHF